MVYTPQLYPVKDRLGNRRYAGIQYDEIDKTYIGSIKCYKGTIIGMGVAETPYEAAANAAIDLDARKDEQRNKVSTWYRNSLQDIPSITRTPEKE